MVLGVLDIPYFNNADANPPLPASYFGIAIDFACFDAIAIGCLTALPPRARRVLRVACGIALPLIYLRGIAGHEAFGFTAIALAAAGIVLGAHGEEQKGWTTGRLAAPLRWVGRHSYELYLFHVIVLAAMRNIMTRAELGYAMRLPWLALFLAASALVAMLVSRHVSEPANRALRGWYRRRTGEGAVLRTGG